MRYCKNLKSKQIKAAEKDFDVRLYITVGLLKAKPLWGHEQFSVYMRDWSKADGRIFCGDIFPKNGHVFVTKEELRESVAGVVFTKPGNI